mmetsp:Transcript_21684/g.66833  ORF Transcript_21684/g.66833 Transcript_21684/m.66833 type:complete len:277 (+) Transcript_21684:845-1675(+)
MFAELGGAGAAERVTPQQARDAVPRGVGEGAARVVVEVGVLVEDVLEELSRGAPRLVAAGVADLERRVTPEHLKHQNSQGPPVDGRRVARGRVLFVALQEELRRDVGERAAEGHVARGVFAVGRQAKVRKARITITFEQNVGGLDVAVDDADGVEVLDGQSELAGRPARVRVLQAPARLEAHVQRAALEVLRHQIQPRLALEGVAELHQVRVAHDGGDLALDAGDVDRVPVHQRPLPHHLQRVRLARRLLAHQQHRAERPAAQQPHGFELPRGRPL